MKQYTVRRYPWGDNRDFNGAAAASSALQFKGCVLLEVPAESITLFDLKNVDYRTVGTSFFKVDEQSFKEVEYRLIAMPYIDQNKEGDAHLSYSLPNSSNQQENFSFENYRSFEDPKVRSDCRELIKNWTGFFDLLSQDSEAQGSEKALRRYEELPALFESLRNLSEPVYDPLIVKISKALDRFMPYVMGGMRKILSREDRLLKIDKVVEMNANSVRWLTRQPGRTLEQKAASKDYQIMAVNRREDYDLLENRVLKDFLHRCVQEAAAFLKDQGDESSSQRYIVRHFSRLCQDCLKRSELEGVRRQRSMPMPNYVLQHDVRYRKIWKYYIDLLRQENKVEELFAWQYFTLSDMACIFTAAALYGLCEEELSTVKLELLGSLGITVWADNRQGSLLNSTVPPGPFCLSGAKRDYIVEFFIDTNIKNTGFDQAHEKAAQAATRLGARSCLLLTPLKKELRPVLILIYSLNLNLQGQDDALSLIEQSAHSSLQREEQDMLLDGLMYEVYGLIVGATDKFASEPEAAGEAKNRDSKAFLTTVCANVEDWYVSYSSLKQSLLHIFEKVASRE